MSDEEKDKEIYNLERDVERGLLRNRDLHYRIYKLERQRTTLIVVVILMILIIFYLLFETPT